MSPPLEHAPGRLALEVLAGALGGAALAQAPWISGGGEVGVATYAMAGAALAPLALLLTPVRGGVIYRATRYAIALAVLGMLATSFAGGADALGVDELLGLGLLAFGAGFLWTGGLALVQRALVDTDARDR